MLILGKEVKEGQKVRIVHKGNKPYKDMVWEGTFKECKESSGMKEFTFEHELVGNFVMFDIQNEMDRTSIEIME